jgi:small subunit ribosomal protein S6
MLIVIPELDEEQVENTIGRFRTIIERTGGEAGEVNHWGRRKLAYEIDHRTDGFYAVMEFTAGDPRGAEAHPARLGRRAEAHGREAPAGLRAQAAARAHRSHGLTSRR